MNIKVFFFKFLIFLLFFGALSLFAQDQGKAYFDKNRNKTSTKSEVVYYRKWKKLGEEKYIINEDYLSGQNINYPSEAKNNVVEGIVYVTFVVQETGKVVNGRVLRGIGAGFDEEAKRVIEIIPKWTSGTQRGKKVNSQ